MTQGQASAARKRDSIILASAMLVWVLVMSVHPHGHGPPVVGRWSLAALVHGTALLVKPVLVYGFCKLAAWQGLPRPLIGIGLSFVVMGQLAMLSAGTVSGWITPAVVGPLLAHGALAGHGEPGAAIQLVRFSGLLNQGYAHVYVILLSSGILLFSLGWRRASRLDRAVQATGLIVGASLLLWQLSGQFRPSPSLMVAVAAGHGLWTLLAAAALGRAAPSDAEVRYA